MKNRSVILDGTSIQLVDSIGELNDGIVMNEVAKPLTREFCKVVAESKGDILDIGFGLGFSANFFIELGVKTYTCIELNDKIYEQALLWAQDKPNVEIIKGDWIDVVPKLAKKYDGIFMDTYGDELEKYAKFEDYAKLIANEGCVLALWEYSAFRKLDTLNYYNFPVHQNNYKLLLRPLHKVCWSYYFANEFRKKKFYSKKNVIPSKLCKEIILENEKESFEYDERSAVVEGIEHTRKVWIKDLKHNQNFFDILKNTYYKHSKAFNSDDLYFCKIIKYTPGCLHDRHLETDKYQHFLSNEQFVDSIVVTLNNDYVGGEFYVYDSWIRNDRGSFSDTKTNTGDIIKFKPFQHSKTNIVTQGVKYEIFIKVKRKEIQEDIKSLI